MLKYPFFSIALVFSTISDVFTKQCGFSDAKKQYNYFRQSLIAS